MPLSTVAGILPKSETTVDSNFDAFFFKCVGVTFDPKDYIADLFVVRMVYFGLKFGKGVILDPTKLNCRSICI